MKRASHLDSRRSVLELRRRLRCLPRQYKGRRRRSETIGGGGGGVDDVGGGAGRDQSVASCKG